jgi:hypothetical protein
MTTRIEFDDRELKQLTRDIGKFGVNANEALTNTMHRTLADTRKELSKDFHASVEGGVANQFIKGSVLANVGRRGRFITEKSDGSPNVKDFESTKSGRVFIGDLQEKILDDALGNATVKELEIGNKDGSRGGGLFTIPRDVKQTRQVNGQKGLVLKYDKRGNVTRFRQKSLQTLREAARNPSNKTYFEVAKKQVSGRNGKQLYPGIYRRERNRC